MARLGKKEREAKRSLIASNLASLKTMGHTPASMGSYLNTDRMLARTHVGFRDAHNVKGSSSSGGGGGRFSAQPRKIDTHEGGFVRQHTVDSLRLKAARQLAAKAQRKGA